MTSVKTRTRRGLVARAAAVLLAAPALGQMRAEVDLAEITSRSIARIATMDLRNNPLPEPQDFEVAGILLGLAQDLQPKDADLVRRRIEAAWSAGDRDLAMSLTEQLLRLDPADTVAQLRLIASRLAQISTIEDRMAAYTRMLDGGGAALDVSVRSRLALDAALLLREQGDQAGFAQRLIQACQLDSTNKEAASLAATFAGPRADQMGRLDLLVNLLMADPLDPNVHASLATEFAAGGAFAACRRFITNQGLLLQASGLPTGAVDSELKGLLWLQDGPQALVEAINRDRVNQMNAVAKQRELGLQRGIPAEKLPKPEDVRSPVPDAVAQVLALDAAGDRPAAEAALSELAETVNRTGLVLLDPAQRPLDMPQAQAEGQLAGISIQLQVTRLWIGLQVEDARAALGADGPLARIAPEAVETLRSWLKLRDGDAQGAADGLAIGAETDETTRIGFALALEQLGRRKEAIEQYRRVIREGVLTLPGVWAASHLAAMGSPVPRDTERLEDYADKIWPWIDRTALRPDDYLNVRLRLADTTLDATDRDRLVLSITNNAPIPLALGADRSISSRMLLAPKLEIPGNFMPALLKPEVLDADRRLRLNPRETLTLDVWPDPGETGLLMELMAFRTARVRWRLIQGFWIDQRGGFRPGPMCLTTETASLLRNPLPDVTFSVESYSQKFKGDPEGLLPRLAVGLRSVLLNRRLDPDRRGDPQPTDDIIIPVATTLTERYPSLSPTCRAMIAAIVPHQRLAPSMKAVDDAVRADEDPTVRCIALVTRVVSADDELLAKATQSDDPRLRGLGELVAARLGKNGRPYAGWTAQFLRRPPDPETLAENPAPEGAPPATPAPPPAGSR